MHLQLESMPGQGSLAIKALASLRRKPKADVQVPAMSVSMAGLRFDAAALEAYRDICGFTAAGVPIAYPQVHAIGLQMHLLSQPQFPLPLVGLVHLKNRIQQQRVLRDDEGFDVTVAVIGSETTERGLEFQLETTYRDARGDTPWSAIATVLYRRKAGPKKAGGPKKEEPASRLADYRNIDAPADIGRRYGRISGDMNPIHLYPLTARLLGFQRHIAHGMWTMARCAALLEPQLGRAPQSLEAQFRNPLFLPGRAALKSGAADGGFEFSLIGRDSGKLHLTGTLR